MLFNSYVFLFVYLPVVALGFYGLAKWSHLSAKVWLAIASIYFYAYWSPTYVVLLMGSIAINFCFSIGLLKLHRQHLRSQTKLLFVLALILNLTLLGYFKYANFFIGNAGTLLGRGWAQEWQLAQIVLPMGISFFTFTQIAFLVDTYQGKVREANPIHYLLFVTYFPHLIAGPILHHGQMMPQFAQSSIFKWNASNFSLGLTLFVFGLAKKVLLADSLLEGVTPTFQPNESESNLSTARAWIGALSYSLQLYFDFSGYSDMAMGLSLMFNVHLPLNFDSPYKARSIIDFWRRWHMTLSQFLRDYLYIALGGNRRGVLLRYLFLMITMLLGGLWHGAAWNFVLWGGLHGIYLIVNHSWRNWWRWGSLPSLCGGLLTYVAVVVAWVFFRANDVPSALYVLNSMFVDYVPSTERWVAVRDAIKYILLGSIIVWCIPSAQQLAARWKNTGFSAWRGLLLAILFLLCVDRLNQVSEFLYFRF